VAVYGDTLCSITCEQDADCGEGGCCLELEETEKYCFDADRCGAGRVDDPCPFGNVHADAAMCGLGLTCLGLAANGGQGVCPSGSAAECSGINEKWNPDCASGMCGASLCAAYCGDERSCPEDYFGTDVISGRCYCVPDREAVEMCIDPVNNIGCSEGNSCIPVGGALLQCVTAGSRTTGESCGGLLGDCIGGHVCAGSGGDTCLKICDHDADTGCEETGGICTSWQGIDRWGVCLVSD
jgi:hypothetical protein